jgi:hypothetical protein
MFVLNKLSGFKKLKLSAAYRRTDGPGADTLEVFADELASLAISFVRAAKGDNP